MDGGGECGGRRSVGGESPDVHGRTWRPAYVRPGSSASLQHRQRGAGVEGAAEVDGDGGARRGAARASGSLSASFRSASRLRSLVDLREWGRRKSASS